MPPSAFARAHPLSSTANALNAVWLLLIGLPCVLFGFYFSHHCQPSLLTFNAQNADEVWWMPKLSTWENTCRFGGQHPLLMANVVLFINMDVFFWLANLAQDSTWLIDPYWTIIPVLLAAWYWIHPLANGDPVRAYSVALLLLVWSARLTYSYFRREEWHFGAREDWRFLELRSQYRSTWWWSSFFLAYVSQHIFLFGVSLPLYAAFHDPRPGFGLVDVLCLAMSAGGIAMAASADNTLRKFMQANEEREAWGTPKQLLLTEGLWAYSRHPNYTGEQTFWWGLGLMSWHQGHSWFLLGPLLNSICLAVATQMVEERMLRNPARRQLYEQYQRTTSVWIPMPNTANPRRRGGGVQLHAAVSVMFGLFVLCSAVSIAAPAAALHVPHAHCSHSAPAFLHAHGHAPPTPGGYTPMPTSPPCGLSPNCDSPAAVQEWIERVGRMTEPLRMNATVYSLAFDDGSDPLVDDVTIAGEMSLINSVLQEYYIEWQYTIVPLQNSTLRERVVLPWCNASWIGDGQPCSVGSPKWLMCNSSASNFAGGDCLAQLPVCQPQLLGDGSCDASCNFAKYGFDQGDCCLGTASETATTCFEPFHPLRAWNSLEQMRAAPFLAGDSSETPGSRFNMYLAKYPHDCLFCGASTTMPWDFDSSEALDQGSVYSHVLFNASLSGGLLLTAGGSGPVHEIGHTLGLWHTFRGQEMAGGLGTQCTNPTDACMDTVQTWPQLGSLLTGDEIDDTPVALFSMPYPDYPGEPGVCGQAPAGVDCHGQPWRNSSAMINFMGFNFFVCTPQELEFTKTQTAKMHCNANQYYAEWIV